MKLMVSTMQLAKLKSTQLRWAVVCMSLLCICFLNLSSNSLGVAYAATADSVLPQDSWQVKRQIMSRPGVMLDMANLTDNGYRWTNDVVWEGTALPADGKWFIAGFLFERQGYKGVWLQYAFSLNPDTGELDGLKRWFGSATFR